MGNTESSSQFPPPSNNGGNNNRNPSWDQKEKSSQQQEEDETPSALKIGAAVAGTALLALGAYSFASSSSSQSNDEGSNGRKRVAQMVNFESEEFGRGSGGGGYNSRGHGPHYTVSSNQRFASQAIKIMTYNVWFREDVEVQERMEAIGVLIQEHDPHIIFLQEVTPNIYELFQDSDWWRKYTCSVSPEAAESRIYFCMLLSKLPVKRFIRKPFENSTMGRELCVAEIDAGANKKLFAATSHLESPTPQGMNSMKRVAQANQALGLLNSAPNVIFGGDMNWDELSDGPFPLLGGWRDAWSASRPGENGWTYDTRSNGMLKGNRPLWKRLDRFVCKLQDFSMESVNIIGTDAIPGISYYNKGKELPVLPSDHYGLVLTINPM